MTNQHPITPPPELVEQWRHSWHPCHGEFVDYIATQSARWGADQELEACCEWLIEHGYDIASPEIRAARRPKPPSLKDQAITALHAIAAGANDTREQHQDLETIRTALEALPND